MASESAKLPLKIKICGLREAENILAVASCGPDWLGFIFYSGSPRFVGYDFVMPVLPKGISKVGVFVNEEPGLVGYEVRNYGLDLVQLSGTETPEDCREVKKSGAGIIKVFHVGPDFDFGSTVAYEDVCEYFLFDTRSEGWGGSGKSFDWALLDRYTGKVPFLLAGGLTPDNASIARSLQHKQFNGLDFNSGVEVSPGFKDVGLVKKILDKQNA